MNAKNEMAVNGAKRIIDGLPVHGTERSEAVMAAIQRSSTVGFEHGVIRRPDGRYVVVTQSTFERCRMAGLLAGHGYDVILNPLE